MRIIELLKNPFFRISSAHILAVSLLIINALVFTDNPIAVVMQFVIAIAISLHHKDDLNIKRSLLNSELQLREDKSIFDRNVIVSETDLEGLITYVNSNYCNATGYTEEELLGQTHSIVKSKETSKETYDKLWATLKAGKTYANIFQNTKKDGSALWVDIHISPIFSNDKQTGYKSIMFDITDRVLEQEILSSTILSKEKELQKQSTRFEFAINSSRDGFWDYDLINHEFYLSEGWKKRLGFKVDEKLTYLDYLNLMSEEYRFEHHKAMHEIIEDYPKNLQYVHFRIRYQLTTHNGERLMIEDVGDVFFDTTRKPVRITGFHRDITDQERQAKIIESQNRVSAMGDMISNIAHQWRQPISAINNTLNNVEFDIELEDLTQIDTETFLDTSNKVKEYTAYLSNTIEDFRKLSSDDKQKTDFHIAHTVKEAYKIVQLEYEQHSIVFQLLEEGEESKTLTGYERELQQVMINLFNNAKDILLEKEITKPRVDVSLMYNKNNIEIYVHDNAGGIPEDIIEKVFDPYFTTKHESLGTGIGLYMSKSIVLDHFKGNFEVSNEDDGAKFKICLPRH